MVVFGQTSDVGRTRNHNEDNLLCRPDKGIWLVADGIGGYASGEIASGIVIEEIPKLLDQGLILSEVLKETHRRIHQSVKQGKGAAGMGSTVVVLLLKENNFEIAWIGDSRAYLWDGLTLLQLTKDHSLVQQLLDSGMINAAEAVVHPQRNVISQALGAGMQDIRVDIISGSLAKGNKILLCTDGLTSEVSDYEISSILAQNKPCQTTTDLLVAAANKNGGGDNITTILVELPEDSAVLSNHHQCKSLKVLKKNVWQFSKLIKNLTLCINVSDTPPP